jgi:putative redox protein
MAHLKLEWQGGLAFKNAADSPAIELHSSTPGITSPTQALAYATMACMGMDVVHVIQKGRHELAAMSVTFDGHRADQEPRRYTAMSLHFTITGRIDSHVVDRAIELSRTKYCSVWHSLREDIRLTTTYTIQDAKSPEPSRP